MLTAVVLRGIKESENLPLYSVSRQELQQQQLVVTGRPLPFPPAAKPAGGGTLSGAVMSPAAGKLTPTTQQLQPSLSVTMTKVGVAKANIINVGRAAASAAAASGQPIKIPGNSSLTITPVSAATQPSGGAAAAAAETVATGSKRKRNYAPKRAAQVRLVRETVLVWCLRDSWESTGMAYF